ncbi:hypothetical protein DFH28DRAFT_955273 [Melampsora americana]|nr:hypothetical protein DFH28DRAFT_955273 [Melampsora americana]
MSQSNQLKQLFTQLKSISNQWPTDPLRKHQSNLQFNQSLSNLFIRLSSNPSIYSNQNLTIDDQINGLHQLIHHLKLIQDGELEKKYPLPDSLKSSDSFPNHYSELKEGIQRAIRGESLPWYKRWFRSQ